MEPLRVRRQRAFSPVHLASWSKPGTGGRSASVSAGAPGPRDGGAACGRRLQNQRLEGGRVVAALHRAIWDVILELRPELLGCCRWEGLELTGQNMHRLYVARVVLGALRPRAIIG